MPKRKILHFLKIASLTILVCFSTLFFSYHLAYAEKVIPGVKVAGISLGNRNQSEVNYILGKKFNERTSQPIELITDGKSFEYSLADLGLDYDLERTTAEAFKIGRRGNIVDDLGTEVRSWFRGVEIRPLLEIEEGRLGTVLLEVAEDLDDPPVEAGFGIKNNDLPAGKAGLRIRDAERGKVVNQEKLESEILTALKNFSTTVVTIPLEDITPEITAGDLETVKPLTEKLLASPVKLTYQSQSWAPTKEEILSFLKFQKENGVVKITVDEGHLSDYIGEIAGQINREARGDIFQTAGDRVINFQVASDGLKLDEGAALSILSAAILDRQGEVPLPVAVAEPLRSANEYGIKELLGQGVSNFAGSSQGRISNIKTASEKLKGILVAPGETFSFNQALGEVTTATGYSTAWVIKKGRTVLGVGGGVCQVSTTIFRAAFNSGLEILERTAHAYRVHYYEPPIGFDATVYEPSPDLVFKNDTASHILIWPYVDVPNTTLVFNFYGTSDGRTTKMIGPFVSGETAPPAPLYQEDDSLPKGTTQQIDWAAWGANATVKREVSRGGEIIHNDTFVSHYQPWQAVFLVGTEG